MLSAWTWIFFADGQLWFRIASTIVAFAVGVGFGVIVLLARWPYWGPPEK